MILSNMPWHSAAIFDEPALETASRTFERQDWKPGENGISPSSAAVTFEKHIQLKNLLEVATTTTGPNKK
jgi:hypothetical protein